jgi:hypothetical protein
MAGENVFEYALGYVRLRDCHHFNLVHELWPFGVEVTNTDVYNPTRSDMILFLSAPVPFTRLGSLFLPSAADVEIVNIA